MRVPHCFGGLKWDRTLENYPPGICGTPLNHGLFQQRESRGVLPGLLLAPYCMLASLFCGCNLIDPTQTGLPVAGFEFKVSDRASGIRSHHSPRGEFAPARGLRVCLHQTTKSSAQDSKPSGCDFACCRVDNVNGSFDFCCQYELRSLCLRGEICQMSDGELSEPPSKVAGPFPHKSSLSPLMAYTGTVCLSLMTDLP